MTVLQKRSRKRSLNKEPEIYTGMKPESQIRPFCHNRSVIIHLSEKGLFMRMRDWWNRLRSRFSKKEEAGAESQTLTLVPEQAPAPVPAQKTSDEMIVQMADAQADPSVREGSAIRSAFEEDFEKDVEGKSEEEPHGDIFSEEAIDQAVFDEAFSEGEWDDFG